MKRIPAKVRSDRLWQDVYQLVESMYDIVYSLVDEYPDEQWTTASRLRSAANDSIFYVSQAVGSAKIDASQYDWNSARKSLFTLQSMYTFAAKQQFFKLEPELVVKIDELISLVDIRLDEGVKEEAIQRKKELEPWLEKYRIWQEIEKITP